MNIQLSIVIPAYNEYRRITSTLQDIGYFLREEKISAEIIVVDDGSTDSTAQTVEVLKDTLPQLRLIKLSNNQGKGAAVKKGVMAAQGAHILFMDADNSTRIDEYQSATEKVSPGNIVIGVRYGAGNQVEKAQGFIRRLISRIGNILIRLITGLSIADTQCGFKVFTQRDARKIFEQLSVSRFAFDIELLVIAKKQGINVHQQFVSWRDDDDSRVHILFGSLTTLRDLLLIRWRAWRGVYNG